MAYIDNFESTSKYKITEAEIHDGLVNILTQNGWTKKLEFKTFYTSPNTYYTGVPDYSTSTYYNYVSVYRHTILESEEGRFFGVATNAYFRDAVNETFYKMYFSTSKNFTDSKCKEVFKEIDENFDKYKKENVKFYYTLEKLPNISDGAHIHCGWTGKALPNVELQEGILDIGYASSDYPVVMQSTIVKSVIRPDASENAGTNWWSDSDVMVKGFVDGKGFMLIMQSDTSPLWENNLVPTVPLYFGGITPVLEGDSAMVLFSGTAVSSPTFDYDSSTSVGELIQPPLKKYITNPSNGIDSVIVSRSKRGARYQSYYLAWNTPSNLMPPEKSDGKSPSRKYPKAWREFKEQFNPSRYSEKVQTSRVYIVHPEEGVRGYLNNIVGLNATNLNASELRIEKEYCNEKKYDVYQCEVVSAVSPLTKKPATAFRPMGIGIMQKVIDKKGEEVVV